MSLELIMEWYYADEADQQISFQEKEFKQLIEVGSIKPNTLVWNSTMPDWRQASLVQPMLFNAGSVEGNPAPGSSAPGSPPPLNVPTTYGGNPAPSDPLGVASLVCGILAILMSCGYGIGLIPGIAAIICGHISRKNSIELGPPYAPSGMSVAGLIMGYIGSAISLVLGIVMISAIVYSVTSLESVE